MVASWSSRDMPSNLLMGSLGGIGGTETRGANGAVECGMTLTWALAANSQHRRTPVGNTKFYVFWIFGRVVSTSRSLGCSFLRQWFLKNQSILHNGRSLTLLAVLLDPPMPPDCEILSLGSNDARLKLPCLWPNRAALLPLIPGPSDVYAAPLTVLGRLILTSCLVESCSEFRGVLPVFLFSPFTRLF